MERFGPLFADMVVEFHPFLDITDVRAAAVALWCIHCFSLGRILCEDLHSSRQETPKPFRRGIEAYHCHRIRGRRPHLPWRYAWNCGPESGHRI
ncbi:hypothetical protein ACN38_g3956 [Penicillium nordicum]|uniref:Uncharacterized protein n=1 Tax=Penicillium nordicum TaxID=229535 RepID=A0A0M8PC40_9EURO|nr:hypothetical protein ACN38_g3956 [Penicillium nordicum]